MLQPVLGADKNATKMKIYELQKEINDYDYKISQEEIKLKKHFEETTKRIKDEYEEEFQTQFDVIEERRNDQYTLEDKKAHLNRQLETLL